jgi:hypothetical protein
VTWRFRKYSVLPSSGTDCDQHEVLPFAGSHHYLRARLCAADLGVGFELARLAPAARIGKRIAVALDDLLPLLPPPQLQAATNPAPISAASTGFVTVART